MDGIDFPPDRIVLVDFDGTIADFDGAVREEAARIGIYPTNNGQPSFYAAEDYAASDRAAVWAIINKPGFTRNLAPLPGLVPGWMSIIKAGFHPVIASRLRPPEYSPTDEAEKLEWLEEHLAPYVGSWVIDEAVFTPDKDLLLAAALVDDKPPRMMKRRGAWTQVVFTQPCNAWDNPSDTLRITGWEDPALQPTLHEAQKRFQGF